MAGEKSSGRCGLNFFVTKKTFRPLNSKIHDFNLEKHTPQKGPFFGGGGRFDVPIIVM